LSGASTFNPRGLELQRPRLAGQHERLAGRRHDNNEYTFNTVIVQPTVESVREF
jgi:hypothetical protein